MTVGLPDMNSRGGLYSELIKELINRGINVTCVAPSQKNEKTGIYIEHNIEVLRVSSSVFVGNIGLLKKGLSVFLLMQKYKFYVRRYFCNRRFDFVLMPTPPASLVDIALYFKRKDNTRIYLILRDIQPECSYRKIIPEEILHKNDVYAESKKPFYLNPIMHKYLYVKSQKLYKTADYIGCMTPGNMEYVLKIAPKVDKKKVLLLPNWYLESKISDFDKDALLKKYDLQGKFIAIFGGTIGAAQGVWNIATLAKHFREYSDIVFLVVGRGPKKQVLMDMAMQDSLTNIRFFEYMPKADYENILAIADVGLISIDEKYRVPTSPSKVIGYMALRKPVVAMFNKGNDFGEFYLKPSNCGLWSEGMDNEKMFQNFEWMYRNPIERIAMGESGYKYYKKHFTVEVVCNELCKQLGNE